MGKDRIEWISHDSYCRSFDRLTPEERHRINFDHPDSLESELLARHLDVLSKGSSVDVPELRKRIDIKLFVDTPADIRFVGRLLRDIKSRERSLESVVEQYVTTVRPMHEEFVEPSKRHADLIIPEGERTRWRWTRSSPGWRL